jgi:stress-induced morphogen
MRVTGWVMTNKIGSKVEFDVEIWDEDVEGMTDVERDDAISEAVREAMFERIEWGWKEAVRG